jgi:hypothetical protein
MYRREHRHELSFEEFFLPFGVKLCGDNRWIKLADLIPWHELEDDYTAQSCKGFGAPASPFRMALGALTIKAVSGSPMKNCLSRSRKTPISSFLLVWKHFSIRNRSVHR